MLPWSLTPAKRFAVSNFHAGGSKSCCNVCCAALALPAHSHKMRCRHLHDNVSTVCAMHRPAMEDQSSSPTCETLRHCWANAASSTGALGRPMQDPTACSAELHASCTANAFAGDTLSACPCMLSISQKHLLLLARSAYQNAGLQLEKPCCMSMHAVQQACTCSDQDPTTGSAARQHLPQVESVPPGQ